MDGEVVDVIQSVYECGSGQRGGFCLMSESMGGQSECKVSRSDRETSVCLRVGMFEEDVKDCGQKREKASFRPSRGRRRKTREVSMNAWAGYKAKTQPSHRPTLLPALSVSVARAPFPVLLPLSDGKVYLAIDWYEFATTSPLISGQTSRSLS